MASKSTDTQGSSPTTQASCPGGISKSSPVPISSSVPSDICTRSSPETVYPTWWYWHDSVPAIALTLVDQRQPGSYTILPTTWSSISTTSTWPCGKRRTSVASENRRRCRRIDLPSFAESILPYLPPKPHRLLRCASDRKSVV